MFKRCVKLSHKVPVATLAGISLLFSGFAGSDAEARHGHHLRHSARVAFFQRHTAHNAMHRHHLGVDPGVRSAAIVVDANSGRTLYALNENELRHPASITKVMTLYLLFEQLEKGRLHLDSELPISQHAAAQPPTKLGLHPGSTIKVEDAIKAIVTRSANDMAVAVAEAIGGDEASFADLMTHKAHALGMSRTHYENASGLPNDEQVTTAHDLAILGRAIQDRFPRYYRYFSTRVFYYAGTVSPNHNHLLDRIEGMDGIKTGYTRASGFNLLTSVKRDGHYIVAVVMGGMSAASRDATMARLIEDEIGEGSTVRTASMINETSGERVAVQDRTLDDSDDDARAAEAPRPVAKPIVLKAEPAPVITPVQVVTPLQLASNSQDGPLDGSSAPAPTFSHPVLERPRPAVVSGAPKPMPQEDHARPGTSSMKTASLDGSTTTSVLATGSIHSATATPSAMRWVTGPAPAQGREKAEGRETAEAQKLAKTELAKTELAMSKKDKEAPSSKRETLELDRPEVSHLGWMIQIGATDDVSKANDLLARAKSKGHRALIAAHPFTEKVRKGSETLYRARFAGLEEDSAESACKDLKRSGFSCFATKN
jgi:D-alanyl-D-alanine carboxypeptidase